MIEVEKLERVLNLVSEYQVAMQILRSGPPVFVAVDLDASEISCITDYQGILEFIVEQVHDGIVNDDLLLHRQEPRKASPSVVSVSAPVEQVEQVEQVEPVVINERKFPERVDIGDPNLANRARRAAASLGWKAEKTRAYHSYTNLCGFRLMDENYKPIANSGNFSLTSHEVLALCAAEKARRAKGGK